MKILYKLLLLILYVNNVLGDSFHFNVNVSNNPIVVQAFLPHNEHLYWKYPGGLTQGFNIELTSSKNLADYKILWPWPEQIEISGQKIYIFNKNIELPILISPKDEAQPIELNINIQGTICNDRGCRLYTQNINQVAHVKKSADLQNKNDFTVTGTEFKKQDVILDLKFTEPLSKLPRFIVAYPNSHSVQEANVSKVDDIYKVECKLPQDFFNQGGSRIIEIYTDVASPKEFELPQIELQQEYTIYAIIIFSLVGGFILNFMPCVLPVLSLKLVSLVRKGTSRSAIFHIAGILLTFNIIAICSLIFKEFGQSFNFGMQFQNPQFVIMLAITIVILISISLERLQFQFSNFVIDKLAGLNIEREYLFDFVNGIIVSVLSTSCSAPLVGVAIGFALTSSALVNICIFNLIALGFSMPYILISIYPDSIKWLPKSGPWLDKMKKFTAVLLIVTLTWLIYILYGQLQIRAVTGLFGLLILIKVIIEDTSKILTRPFVRIGLFILISAAALYLPAMVAKEDEEYAAQKESLWHPFSDETLEHYIKADKVVFVDITADWCATCQYNKIFVLDRVWTTNMLKKYKVVNLRGSLNKPSEEIAHFMAKYGSYAIPFNIVYGPGAPKGIILPINYGYYDLVNAIKKANSKL